MQLTTLKLRTLKPCGSTSNMLHNLPSIEGFGEHMFQFNVKIPARLWKSILDRKKLVQQRPYYTTQLALEQAISADAITARYDADVISGVMRESIQTTVYNAVHITPVDAELFDRFDIRVLRGAAILRGPDVINFNVVLSGTHSNMEAIYDVSDFPVQMIGERPPDTVVSYIINI